MSHSIEEGGEESLFFYADEDVELYDELAPLTDPAYELIHKSLVSQFSSWIKYKECESSFSSDFLIFDVGCGTGAEAIGLLRASESVRVVGVDISQGMLEQFRGNLKATFPNDSVSRRCALVQSDIRDPHWCDRAFNESNSQGWNGELSAVVTVYMLHHFSVATKREIYKRIYTFLPPGGAFVNADLYSFDTPWLANMAQLSIESWITSEFDKARKNKSSNSVKSSIEWRDLAEHWLKHVREDNHPLPAIEACATESLSSNADNEKALLCDAGFNTVECSFRLGQSAILWAFKEE